MPNVRDFTQRPVLIRTTNPTVRSAYGRATCIRVDELPTTSVRSDIVSQRDLHGSR